MKRLSVIFTAMLSVLVFASFAFAANRVEVKVTSEPIQYHATCDKAGGFSLEFDANSVLKDGDQITIDLPFVTATDRATLCRNIDMIISPRNATIASVDLNNLQPEDVYTDTPGYTPIPLEGVNSPIFYKGTAPTYTALGGVLFRVRGTAGGSRITLDVIGYNAGDSVTVGPLADDKVVIKLFDQAEYLSAPFGLLKVSDVDPDVYDAFATSIDNVICINVSSYSGSVVKAYMDSKDDKFTFIPSDPQIAHIVPAVDITLDPCKGSKTGYIPLPEEQADCVQFDYEESVTYCSDTHDNKIVIKNSGVFDEVDYQIRLEILEPAGVYWTNEVVKADAHTNKSDACGSSAGIIIGTQANYTYLDADGDELDPGDIVALPTNCEVDEDAQAKVVMTDAESNLVTTNDIDYIQIDMPSLIYDSSVTAGQEVKVKATLIKAPCGEIFSETILVGTFGCEVTPSSTTLVYPYFTKMDSDADVWWDGFVVTNASATAGTATVMAYEKDGDVGKIEISVPANSLEVSLLSSYLSNMTLETSVDGTLGNSPVYLIVTCDFNAYGFAMIANPATGESMGYLPER